MASGHLTFHHVQQAAGRLLGRSILTPLLRQPELDRDTGARVVVKPECLQRSGSFKYRGAFNALSRLTAEQRRAGVLAWSSGNHAQGVAAAAQELGITATIVMPQDAPRTKVDNTRAYGAEVVFYHRTRENREDVGRALAEARGATIIAPYDNYDVMAGQGTCGLEIAEQARARDITLDVLLVCCGGGGLSAGVATAMQHLSPGTELWAVEPEHFDDHARSLHSGRREQNKPGNTSICDALLAPSPGELTFEINRQLLTGALTVSDAQVRRAMRYAFSRLKLVVEPGGAVALAALLENSRFQGCTVGVIISGGNVDPALFADIIRAPD